jgi:hypothetical protein
VEFAAFVGPVHVKLDACELSGLWVNQLPPRADCRVPVGRPVDFEVSTGFDDVDFPDGSEP